MFRYAFNQAVRLTKSILAVAMIIGILQLPIQQSFAASPVSATISGTSSALSGATSMSFSKLIRAQKGQQFAWHLMLWGGTITVGGTTLILGRIIEEGGVGGLFFISFFSIFELIKSFSTVDTNEGHPQRERSPLQDAKIENIDPQELKALAHAQIRLAVNGAPDSLTPELVQAARIFAVSKTALANDFANVIRSNFKAQKAGELLEFVKSSDDPKTREQIAQLLYNFQTITSL